MAGLIPIKTLQNQDYQGAPSAFMPKLIYILNLVFGSLYAALNNGLTFQQNSLAQINTASITGASPTTTFKWKFASAPVGVVILSVTDTSSSPKTTSATSCAWSYNAGTITINNITGLVSSQPYSVTFLVIGG